MKFCQQCGTGHADNAVFCQRCGTSFDKTKPEQPHYSAPTADYSKLGGWLLFFVTLCIFDTIVGFSNICTFFSSKNGFSAVFLFEALCLEIIFVVCVLKRNHYFLLFYQLGKIVSIIGCILAFLNSGNFFILIINSSGLLLMTLYFCKSERVEIYIGSNEYRELALFRI